MLLTERRWRSGLLCVVLTAGLHSACGDDDAGPNQSTGGRGGTSSGGSNSKAGQGGTPSLGGSAGSGGRAAGGRDAMAGAGATSDAGAPQGGAAEGGAPQSEGGAAQGGSQQTEGGTAPTDGGANEAGLGGAGGAGGADGESCAGELVSGKCVLPHPVRRIQSAKRTAGTGAMSDVVKLPAATTSGNLLVLGVGIVWPGVAQALTAPAGFTLVEQRDNATGTTQHESAALYIVENAPSLPAATGVTVSSGVADTRIYLVLVEYAGLSASGSVDRTASQSGSSGLLSGVTAQTSVDEELWVAITVSRGGGGHTDPTNGFAMVEMSTTGAGSFSFTEYFARQRGAASSSLTGGGDYAAIIATFH